MAVGVVRKLVVSSALALVGGELLRRAIQRPGGRYSYTPSLAAQLFAYASVWLDQHVGWRNLPLPFGLGLLLGERVMLRWQNLHDTNTLPTLPQPDLPPRDTSYLVERTIDADSEDHSRPEPAAGQQRAPQRTSICKLRGGTPPSSTPPMHRSRPARAPAAAASCAWSSPTTTSTCLQSSSISWRRCRAGGWGSACC